MGISGLLPFAKNSCRPSRLKDFSGATVAIDAYSWLHKGAFSCAEKLVKGEKTDGYIYYCIKLLNMILESGLKPIMVFDGCNLKSKEGTEKKRRENREKTRQKGKELLCEGKVKEARECFQRCVDVTPEMAREVIMACRKKSVDCIVAPYEADAQLAYLARNGIAQLIITEDSDLILFGCDRILFKMDSGGGGLLYEKDNLFKSFGAKSSKFSFEKFRYMCILSGCDYLPSLPGIGLQKACKFFSLTDNMDLNSVLSKLPSYLKMPKLTVTDEYKKSFVKANNTFLYQLVYCTKKKGLVPLNPYPDDLDTGDMDYAGKYLPDDLAHQLAMGNINIKTMQEFPTIENDACSHVDVGKSFVWDPEASFSKKEPVKTDMSAFKFNTPKQSLPVPQKRRMEEEIYSEMPSTDEELFAMYRRPSPKKRHSDFDLTEEDPLYIEPDMVDLSPEPGEESQTKTPLSHSPMLPFRKIVRSRFFTSGKKSFGNHKPPESSSESKNISNSLPASNASSLGQDSYINNDSPQSPDLPLILDSYIGDSSSKTPDSPLVLDSYNDDNSPNSPDLPLVLNSYNGNNSPKSSDSQLVLDSYNDDDSLKSPDSQLVLDFYNDDNPLKSPNSSIVTDIISNFNLELVSPSGRSPKKSNKENIRNIFAKKKPSDQQTAAPQNNELKTSPRKSDSLFDMLDGDTETHTVSSNGYSSKRMNSGDILVLTPKQKPKRLITTKLTSFKWKKDHKIRSPASFVNSETKLELSQCSDSISVDEGFESGRLLELDDTGSQESSSFFETINHSDSGESKQIVEKSPYFGGSSIDVLTLSDSDECDDAPAAGPSKVLKPIDNKSVKPGKCRTLGLSKNKKATRKETLLNFNFIRQRRSDAPSVT